MPVSSFPYVLSVRRTPKNNADAIFFHLDSSKYKNFNKTLIFFHKIGEIIRRKKFLCAVTFEIFIRGPIVWLFVLNAKMKIFFSIIS